MLDYGHLTIHTWPEYQSCAIDFYLGGPNISFTLIREMEEKLCDNLGWECCTSTLSLVRGGPSKILVNDTDNIGEILKQIKLLHREKSPFQEIKVYDTLTRGRILMLDSFIQISDQEEEDDYTIKIVSTLLRQERDYDSVLIIGGGDLLVANYILKHFGRVKHIVLCEIDEQVVKVV